MGSLVERGRAFRARDARRGAFARRLPRRRPVGRRRTRRPGPGRVRRGRRADGNTGSIGIGLGQGRADPAADRPGPGRRRRDLAAQRRRPCRRRVPERRRHDPGQGRPRHAEGARQAAEEAIAEGAELIVGPLFAPSVQAAGQVAKQAGKPVIAFSTDATRREPGRLSPLLPGPGGGRPHHRLRVGAGPPLLRGADPREHLRQRRRGAVPRGRGAARRPRRRDGALRGRPGAGRGAAHRAADRRTERPGRRHLPARQRRGPARRRPGAGRGAVSTRRR